MKLIAAGITPFSPNGAINPEPIKQMTEALISAGVQGLYVLGSTGEGFSLSSSERRVIAEEYVHAAKGRLPVFVQVGHNSIEESRDLAAHAEGIGADYISANAPSYFKVTSIPQLITYLKELCAAAPRTPFYYYHIPFLTGADLDMVEFLKQAEGQLPTLKGIKFSDPNLGRFLQCREYAGDKFEILWGSDENLLPAMACGAAGAIGSTYNLMPALYQEIIELFNQGKLTEARVHMKQACDIIDVWLGKHAPLHPSLKATMRLLGFQVGQCRTPLVSVDKSTEKSIQASLRQLGFFDWAIGCKTPAL